MLISNMKFLYKKVETVPLKEQSGTEIDFYLSKYNEFRKLIRNSHWEKGCQCKKIGF